MVSNLVSDVAIKSQKSLFITANYQGVGVSPLFSQGPLFNTVSRCLALIHHKLKWRKWACRIERIGEKWRAILAHLYTTSDVCEQLNISRSTLYRLINAGELETVKVRNCSRFTQKTIDGFIDRQLKKSREALVGF
jgi:excisionase family DNA binding protein